jgi:hypothetical protein
VIHRVRRGGEREDEECGDGYGLQTSFSTPTARTRPLLSLVRARMTIFPGRARPVSPRSGMRTVFDPQRKSVIGGP